MLSDKHAGSALTSLQSLQFQLQDEFMGGLMDDKMLIADDDLDKVMDVAQDAAVKLSILDLEGTDVVQRRRLQRLQGRDHTGE